MNKAKNEEKTIKDTVQNMLQRLREKRCSHLCRFEGNTYSIEAVTIQDIEHIAKDMCNFNNKEIPKETEGIE